VVDRRGQALSAASAALLVVDPRHCSLPPSSPLLLPPVAVVALVAPLSPSYLVKSYILVPFVGITASVAVSWTLPWSNRRCLALVKDLR